MGTFGAIIFNAKTFIYKVNFFQYNMLKIKYNIYGYGLNRRNLFVILPIKPTPFS